MLIFNKSNSQKILFLKDQAKNLILDILFPYHCIHCYKESKNILCPECLKMIPLLSEFTCPNCQKTMANFSHHCYQKNNYLSSLGAASFYENEILKKAIFAFKYQPIKEAYLPLSEKMILFLKNSSFFNYLLKSSREDLVVAPIPLHQKKEKQRGFNQSDLLAQEIAQEFSLFYQKDLLTRIKNNSPQANINNPLERKQNVSNIFQVNKKYLKENSQNNFLKNKIILLVDDVFTTGATLNEAAKVLKQNGAKKIVGLVLAK
ncbi:MAG TPA: ComF family protein [Candidatus Paceibacterota bacterium]|nr:ComF family protein [Candidatus Paceibacterota bacterium]HPQ22752.1 ComF family protein [Candidatus Paceibacterota bacterium]